MSKATTPGHDLAIARLRPGRSAKDACRRLGITTIGDFLACDEARFVTDGKSRRATWLALQTRVDEYLQQAAAAALATDRPLMPLVDDQRAEQVILAMGLATVRQFLATPKAELLAAKGFGERSWQRIHEQIRATQQTPTALMSLLPDCLVGLAIDSASLSPELVGKLKALGSSTFGDLFALPATTFAAGSTLGPPAASAVRNCLEQLFRVGLAQVMTPPESGAPDWNALATEVLAHFPDTDRQLLAALIGLGERARTPGEIALAVDTDLATVEIRAVDLRRRLLERAPALLGRLRYEIIRELEAFEGVVTGDHLAPGSTAHAAATQSGDAMLPLRLCAFAFPDEFHLNNGCLTSLPGARYRQFVRVLRHLTRRAILPVPVDQLVKQLREVVDPVPRGLLLHLLRELLSLTVQIDSAHGEVVQRARNSAAVRLHGILTEERKPLRIEDLVFHYRDRYRAVRESKVQISLRSDPLFVEVGQRLWSLRQWHRDEIAAAAPLAEQLARRVCETGGRHHVAELMEDRECTVRTVWLVLDCLRRDPRIRYLGCGDVCPATSRKSSVLDALLKDFRHAMGEVPMDRFLNNQPEERRRLVRRLLMENRLFVQPQPGRVDVLTNYPFDDERTSRLLEFADGYLESHNGYQRLSDLLPQVRKTDLGGEWLSAHLLGDILRRHGSFELLPGGFVARREMELLGWVLSRARRAVYEVGIPLSTQEILVARPELAEFAECLEDILHQDPMLCTTDGSRWQVV